MYLSRMALCLKYYVYYSSWMSWPNRLIIYHIYFSSTFPFNAFSNNTTLFITCWKHTDSLTTMTTTTTSLFEWKWAWGSLNLTFSKDCQLSQIINLNRSTKLQSSILYFHLNDILIKFSRTLSLSFHALYAQFFSSFCPPSFFSFENNSFSFTFWFLVVFSSKY